MQRQIAEIDRGIRREETRIGNSVELAYQSARAREDARARTARTFEATWSSSRTSTDRRGRIASIRGRPARPHRRRRRRRRAER